jgi:hypothetical protein
MKTISKEEYQRLVGLLTLARDYNRALQAVLRAAQKLTGDTQDLGPTSDAVYGSMDADQLLRQLVLLHLSFWVRCSSCSQS